MPEKVVSVAEVAVVELAVELPLKMQMKLEVDDRNLLPPLFVGKVCLTVE